MLILDEPFGALDATTKKELQEELLNIWNEYRCTVLMITHDIGEALFLADHLVMMTNGPAATIGEVVNIPFERPRDCAHLFSSERRSPWFLSDWDARLSPFKQVAELNRG